jgi:hypothetical protein
LISDIVGGVTRPCCSMAVRREEIQLVFERKVLRTICGSNVENSAYRSRHNFELDREFDSPKKLRDQKTRRLTTESYSYSKTARTAMERTSSTDL